MPYPRALQPSTPQPSLPPAQSLPASLRYRRPAVRDLAWLVLDGALEWPQPGKALATVRLAAPERAEFLDLLQRWDEGPDDAWLGPIDPRLRLGLYTERLIGAWLRHCRQIRLLAMNWPLRDNRITLGEADFLVERDVAGAGQRQLWEVACKFYLGVPGRGWLGPELNDSLAAKLSRVRGHQLRLIHQAGFEAAWGNGWSACAWITGWLLGPASLLDAPAPVGRLPSRSQSPTRIPAVWAEAGSASLAVAARHARELDVTQWWLLPKRRWLRPVYDDEPVARVFASLADAADFLTRGSDGEASGLTSEAVVHGSAHRFTGEEGPRPLMLAGVRWLCNAGTTATASRGAQEAASGGGRDDAGAGAETRVVIAEAMRLMLVPPGWSLRALGMALHPDSLAEGGTEVAGGREDDLRA